MAPLLLLMLGGCDGKATESRPYTAVASPWSATAIGRVDSDGEARQLVAATDGVIARLLVERGDRVAAGQALLHIDCGQRQANVAANQALADQAAAMAMTVAQGSRKEQIAAANAVVVSASAAVQEAGDRLAQARGLIGAGFVSRRELASRENGYVQAQAALAEAQAHAAVLAAGPRDSERAGANAAARAARSETNAAAALAQQCILTSPIDGQVLQIMRREGEFSGASQGLPLIIVGNLETRIVRAEIGERDAAKVTEGQVADIWIEGEKPRWRGRIIHLANIMGRRTARASDPTDRFDRDTREAVIAFDGAEPPPLVGLRVIVGLRP
jgi:multidrug resistance efflux pump